MKRLVTLALILLLTLALALPVSAYTLYDPATLGYTTTTRIFTAAELKANSYGLLTTGYALSDAPIYAYTGTPGNFTYTEVGKLSAGDVVSCAPGGAGYYSLYFTSDNENYIYNTVYNASTQGTWLCGYSVKTSDFGTEPEIGKILCDSTTDPQAQMYYVLTKKAISDGAVGTGEVSFLSKVGNTLTQRRSIDIPDSVQINGLTYLVTSIQPCASSNLTYTSNTPIRTINIGANVRSIGDYAFYNTKGLKYINFNGCIITSNNYGKGVFRSSKAKVTYNVSNQAELKAAYKKSRAKTSSKPYVNGATYVTNTFGGGTWMVYDSSLKSYTAKAEYIKSMQSNGYISKTLKKIPGTNVKGYRYLNA